MGWFERITLKRVLKGDCLRKKVPYFPFQNWWHREGGLKKAGGTPGASRFVAEHAPGHGWGSWDLRSLRDPSKCTAPPPHPRPREGGAALMNESKAWFSSCGNRLLVEFSHPAFTKSAVVSGWEPSAGPGKCVLDSRSQEETDHAPFLSHCYRVGLGCPQTGLLWKKVHINSWGTEAAPDERPREAQRFWVWWELRREQTGIIERFSAGKQG